MHQQIREQLINLADQDYQKFSSSLIPNCQNILGVRLPELRKIAKNIAKEDWQNYLTAASDEFFEEVMLQGMIIGYVKTNSEERLSHVASFVPKIDNWSVCDSFCTGLKFTKENQEQVWVFLQPYFSSNKEYEVRFGVVMLLNYFIDHQYIQSVLNIINAIKHEGYYVKMAVAWAISICYVKDPLVTMNYLRNNSLDDFTYHKALQKITESNRVDKEAKNLIRQMKRKI
ncbi:MULTISPECIES: DNA alkylation repair protein [Lysinibacillus]|uniref:DNA alkylation repair protein n=1 Tax=Lysinibacillus TaxID=400634 RepID=UPI00257A6FDC|nr:MULTISPECIES: DNA alkylation repair protein [Lysinibacillus]